jgi:trk system potassium uptake protein TrkH
MVQLKSSLAHKTYINIPMLLRVIGWLLVIEAGFMIFPLIAAFVYPDSDVWVFALSIIITACCGFLMTRLHLKSRDMGMREAIMLTSLTWIILSLFGMIPFLLSRTHMDITDAYFESINGFTTTGASLLDSLADVPKSVLLWRSIQQWIGGMGIILFTLAIVPMLNNQGGMFMFNAEVTGITHDKLRPRISSTAKGLWLVYVILTALVILLLSISDMPVFDAVCHGLSTISTGGFSTQDLSIEAWNSNYIKTVVIIFMFLGSVNFSLIYKASSGNFKDLAKNTVLRWFVGIIVVAYLLNAGYLLINGLYENIEDLTIDPLFQVVSTISSTAISEPDFHNWGAFPTLIMIILMFSGACSGSTSGGAKVDRLVILYKFLKNEFFKVMHPNNVMSVSMNGKGISYVMVQKVLAFLALYIFVISAGAVLLVLMGLPIHDSFFYCLSAISNAAMDPASVGIGASYTLLPDAAKWLLGLIMLIGRLELYTILLIFSPIFWKNK